MIAHQSQPSWWEKMMKISVELKGRLFPICECFLSSNTDLSLESKSHFLSFSFFFLSHTWRGKVKVEVLSLTSLSWVTCQLLLKGSFRHFRNYSPIYSFSILHTSHLLLQYVIIGCFHTHILWLYLPACRLTPGASNSVSKGDPSLWLRR